LFTTLAARSIADSGAIRLPFGTGRTSPIATDDVARVVATISSDPGPYIDRVLELPGPRSQHMNGVAEEFARPLSRPVSYVDARGRRGPSKSSQAPSSDRTSMSTSRPWPGYIARIGTTA
jgi:uncharacterized protein YbjT (DUF2867 family)